MGKPWAQFLYVQVCALCAWVCHAHVYKTAPPLSQTHHILLSKPFTEFENIVHIFFGKAVEPQLSDNFFHVLRGIDLNKTIEK